MLKYPNITDISLVTDTISIYRRKKTISKVPIRYRYIDISNISTTFSIYRPTSRIYVFPIWSSNGISANDISEMSSSYNNSDWLHDILVQYLDDVDEDSVQLAMSEALEDKVNPAVHTADVFTSVRQLCDHLPYLQHSLQCLYKITTHSADVFIADQYAPQY